MEDLSKNQKIISFVFQIIAALILAMASFGKFTNQELSIYIFKFLGIEESRLIIATIEGLAAFLLLTKFKMIMVEQCL